MRDTLRGMTTTNTPKSAGRPSKFSDALIEEICDRIAEGESMRRICEDDHMPWIKTVTRWLADPDHVDFVHKYARARTLQADKLVEEIMEISDEPAERLPQTGGKDSADVADKRLRVDTRKWIAAKLAPKKYGEKVEVDVGNTDDKPFQISDSEAAAKLAAIIASGLARKAQADDASDLL